MRRQKIHFRTEPGAGKGRLDSFEEDENRSGALRTTLWTLLAIALVTAGLVLAFLRQTQRPDLPMAGSAETEEVSLFPETPETTQNDR